MAFQINRSSFFFSSLAAFCLAVGGATLVTPDLRAQDKSAPKPDPDVLIFVDGEKLIGKLVRSVGSTLTFKSDIAGEVKVDWSKVKELHTDREFAVIPKGVKVYHRENASGIPQGTLSVADKNIEIHPPSQAPKTVPVTGTQYVVDDETFQKAILNGPNFFQQWKGAVTAGASIVAATQSNRTVTAAVALSRSVPGENWLSPRNRTNVNANVSYGNVTQPDTPTVKTEIYHADAERDQYFTGSRMYGFAQAAFDHNFSQGLDLQQAYGGGIGWTAIQTDLETLDLKVAMTYVNQQFQTAARSQKLIGSSFGETYNRHMHHDIVLSQVLTLTPAWNNADAFSGNAGVTAAMPILKKFSLTLGTVDTFLNDPPPGFKKNSFQFTAGISYTLP